MRCPVLPLLQVSRILLLHSASRPVAMVLLMKASKHPTVKIIARATQSMHMPRPLIRGPRRWIWTRPSLRLRSNDNPPYIFFFCFFFLWARGGSGFVLCLSFPRKKGFFLLDLFTFCLGFMSFHTARILFSSLVFTTCFLFSFSIYHVFGSVISMGYGMVPCD